MLWGETTWMERVGLVVAGLGFGLVKPFWDYLKVKRDQEPALMAARRKDAADRRRMEQEAEDRLYSRIPKTWFDELQMKVDKIEHDHVECQRENARLNERCDHLSARIKELEGQIGGSKHDFSLDG